MNFLPEIDDFQSIFQDDIPLIDTRAPVEFERGSFPCSSNIPLMDNDERHLVGIEYKKNGRNSAIELGRRLVSGDNKEAKLNAWLNFIKKNPNGALYCYRGGLRSEIVQQWIFDSTGISYPRIKGGFKYMRNYLVKELEQIIKSNKIVILGGKTGCGKTALLNQFKNSIDLEGLANHRGSAFGKKLFPQPSQIAFENALAIEFLYQRNNLFLVLEDEGSNIGKLYLPTNLKNKALQSDLVILCASINERIQSSLKTYVVDMLGEFIQKDNENGFGKFEVYWKDSLFKIKKRLGGLRYVTLLNMLNKALETHKKLNEIDLYIPLIEALLVDYYDPMYDYQIKKKKSRIIFKGDSASVIDYLNKKLIP